MDEDAGALHSSPDALHFSSVHFTEALRFGPHVQWILLSETNGSPHGALR